MLVIEQPNGLALRPSDSTTFYLTVKNLTNLSVSGFTRLASEGPIIANSLSFFINGRSDIKLHIQANSLHLTCNGHADVSLYGAVDKQTVVLRGSGDYRAEALQCRHADMTIVGRGKAAVSVQERLAVHTSGFGEVQYRGKPSKIEQHIAGRGTVTKLS